MTPGVLTSSRELTTQDWRPVKNIKICLIVIKLVPLFIFSLLIMVWSQIYVWHQDPSIAGLHAQLREADINMLESRVAFPANQLLTSGDSRQKRKGCKASALRYRKYTVNANQHVAVVYRGTLNLSACLSLQNPEKLPCLPPLPERPVLLSAIASVSDVADHVQGSRSHQCQQYCRLGWTLSLQEVDSSPSFLKLLTAHKEMLTQGMREITLRVQRGNGTKSVTLPWDGIAPLYPYSEIPAFHRMLEEGGQRVN